MGGWQEPPADDVEVRKGDGGIVEVRAEQKSEGLACERRRVEGGEEAPEVGRGERRPAGLWIGRASRTMRTPGGWSSSGSTMADAVPARGVAGTVTAGRRR
jgi:hypothetical protein